MPKITVVAPASPLPGLTPEKVAAWTDFWAQKGYSLSFSASCFKSNRFLAGTDADRARDIQAAFGDKDTDFVMALKGGYGSPRLLDKLDYDLIRHNPKPFIGFSDNTALQAALLAKAGLPSLTGFNASFTDRAETAPLLFQTLTKALLQKPQTFDGLKSLGKGQTTGPLVGGTLSLFCHLLGTPYLPDLTGAVLVLEEVGEQPYKVDKMLTHLRLAGVFQKVSGIVLGAFERCHSTDPADGTIEEVLCETFGHLDMPVVTGLPYGHTPDHAVFPLGTKAVLDADAGTLSIAPLPFPSL